MAKGKYGGNILLLVVLVGFCILAIVEIFHGQAQIRAKKEKLAVEEERGRVPQAAKPGRDNSEERGNLREQGNSEDDPGAETGSVDSTGEADEGDDESEPTEDDRKYDMQIVLMGDNILDRDRENGGVASLVADACNARVYNMAIDGTTAAVLPNESTGIETWQSIGLLGVVHAIVGDISPGIFDGYRAGEILKECDFSETDYFVIEYGINDFLCGQVPQSIYLANGDVLDMDRARTYVGALEVAVSVLHEHFPDAKILLIPPHFCQIFEGEAFIGDAYSLNYGYGTLVDFARVAEYVKTQDKEGIVIFYNTIENSGIDSLSAKEYLEDGIHLSEKGRRVYADHVSRLIKADFYREE